MANDENLKPFTGADDPRRQNGRPKGTKNLSTIIRELEDENFDWSKVPLKQHALAITNGSPWRAIVLTAVVAALDGNVKAMEWLRKSGYGDKMIHEFPNGFFNSDAIKVEIVEKKVDDGNKTEPQADSGSNTV